MTYNEARELVANASSKEWLNSKATAQFSYAYLNKPFVITGVLPILKHILENEEGWGKYQNLPEGIKNSHAFYVNLKNHLTKFLRSISTQDESWLNGQWYNVVTQPVQNGSRHAIEHNCPEGKFLQELYEKQPQSVEGAYQFLTNSGVNNFRDRQFLTGMLLAYEFKEQEASELGQRRDKSKRSIAALRNEAKKYLTESEEHLTKFLADAKQASEQNSQAINELQKTKEEAFDSWFAQTKTDFEKFDQGAQEWLVSQEKLYREKLRLEKPAEYWKLRAEKLKSEGQTYLWCLAVATGLGVLLMFLILWLVPDGLKLDPFTGDATAIKWTIVFITFISFLAFGIRTLAKLTYSAFHLRRDAEEREQLAYVYLALRKDGNVDEAERHLIMQSLFSRAETGLLKDDSSPTMPGNVMERVLNGGK